jgi:two-component system, sensor histidine kinase YesM
LKRRLTASYTHAIVMANGLTRRAEQTADGFGYSAKQWARKLKTGEGVLKHRAVISSRKRVMQISLVLIVPLIVFLIGYNVVTMNIINTRIETNNKSTVRLYQKALETDLKNIEQFIVDLRANGTEYRQLMHQSTQLNAYLAWYDMNQRYRMILKAYPVICGMYLYSEVNGLYKKTYNEGYKYVVKTAVEEYIRGKVEGSPSFDAGRWYMEEIKGRYFLFRICGIKGTYIICTVSLDNVSAIQNASIKEGFILFSSGEGEPLTDRETVEREGIRLQASADTFYLSGERTRFFIVQERSEYDFNTVYLIPYSGWLNNLDGPQILLILATLLLFALIVVSYLLLHYSYFKPLNRLVSTMNRIRDGNFGEKMSTEYRITEFNQFGRSFNEMMEQIRTLKIATYEKELRYQRIQMQYLLIQIRPHFFLNCLKNLYNMAQEGKQQEIQELILALSKYLRGMLRDSMVTIPLRQELDSVRSYVMLQQISAALRSECSIDVAAPMLDVPVPPMLILTFVENAYKYGVTFHKPLIILVTAREEEGCLRVGIADNGKGFSAEHLVLLNGEDSEFPGEHVGIYNIKQRLSVIYNRRNSILFSNRDGGAGVDIRIPLDV